MTENHRCTTTHDLPERRTENILVSVHRHCHIMAVHLRHGVPELHTVWPALAHDQAFWCDVEKLEALALRKGKGPSRQQTSQSLRLIRRYLRRCANTGEQCLQFPMRREVDRLKTHGEQIERTGAALRPVVKRAFAHLEL